MRNRVAVLHGVNLDVLERRARRALRRADVHRSSSARSASSRDELGLEARFFQTNHEGEFVEELHRLADYADGLILNPGAWTHYAWALRDALEIAGLPAVEVHLSDVDAPRGVAARLGARRAVRARTVAGQGVDGYRDALERAQGGARA